MTSSRTIACGVGLVWAMGMMGTARATSIPPELVDRATAATVLIRVDHVYLSEEIAKFGTGFLIHPDGYLLTDADLVAPTVDQEVAGHIVKVKSTIQRTTVVEHSGTPDEVAHHADVVSRDEATGLALLKIERSGGQYLEITAVPIPQVAEPVWLVGFPYGDLLSADLKEGRRGDKNPEVSVNLGRVTSLRHDASGRVSVIQTDAMVNPGNKGGPLLDLEGRVVGLVSMGIRGGPGIGLATAPDVLRRFVDYRAFKVSFQPPVISPQLETLTVAVEPLLANLDGLSGSVTLKGADLEDFSAPFIQGAGGLLATLSLPAHGSGAEAAKHYTATLEFRAEDGEIVVERSFRIPTAAGGQPAAGGTSAPTAGDSQSGPRGKKTLAAAAAGVKLQGAGEGPIVIDDSTLGASGGGPRDGDPRYSELPLRWMRSAAYEFDSLRRTYCSFDYSAPAVPPGVTDWRRAREMEVLRQKSEQFGRLTDLLQDLKGKLMAAGALRCSDGTWTTDPGSRHCLPPELHCGF